MDAELERLGRAAASGDPEAVRRHEAALLRAGRRDEVEARYWAKFVCVEPWEALDVVQATGRGRREVRRCGRCSARVEITDARDAFAELVAGRCTAIESSLDALGRAIDLLIDGRECDGGPRPPGARLHLEGGDEGALARHHLPLFLGAHPHVHAALERAGVEVVPFGLGSFAEPDALLRWWPHLLELLAGQVQPALRPVVLLEGNVGSIGALLEQGLVLPDLAGWLALGPGGAMFLGPDGEEVDDIEAHVLEWCRRLDASS